MTAILESPIRSMARGNGNPLLPVRGVMSLIDRNEDQILKMAQSGELLWVFDLSLEPERTQRRELRILPACVADYLLGRKCDLDWATVLDLILPPNNPRLSTEEVTRALNVSNAHVFALARRNLIPPAVSTWRRGPGNSAQFLTADVADFLRGRRFP